LNYQVLLEFYTHQNLFLLIQLILLDDPYVYSNKKGGT
jgi:hypothetical protein